MKSAHYEQFKTYVHDITVGNIPAGQFTRKAVKRFNSDIRKSAQPSYLYEFKPELVENMINFAEALFIPDIQKRLELLPWMLFLFYNLYGWVLKADNTVRRFRRGYCEVARKNSKTTSILNPLILYDFFTTPSAESYLVSKDEGLSEKSYQELKQIIMATPELKALVENKSLNMTSKAIVYKGSRISYFEERTAGVDGYRNSLSIIDEYHAYDSDRIVTSFQKGGRARKNCLTLCITSAGNDISKPCYSENLFCKKILNGILTDEQYFGIIYAVDEEDKWDDESIYVKANPSLGVITRPEALHSDLIDAQTKPHHKPDFLAKTLGRWSNAKSNWIPIEKIEQNDKDTTDFDKVFAKDSGRIVCGALDLAMVRDLCCFSLVGSYKGKFYFRHWFFIPSETVQERYQKDNADFLRWIDDGIITLCIGSSNDFEFIADEILKCCEKYNIQKIGYDRWQANTTIKKVDAENPNLQLIEIDQSLRSFSPITKEYEKAIYDGLIVDNNPCSKWCLSNAVVLPDNNGNYKPLKENKDSTQHIDSVVTSIMALSLVSTVEAPAPSRSFDDVLAMI